MVKAKVMQKVRWSNFYEKYSYKRNTKTVAPHEILNETIDLWNHLLDIVEKDLLDPNAVNYARAGMIPDLKTDMNKYRKKNVELDSLPT